MVVESQSKSGETKPSHAKTIFKEFKFFNFPRVNKFQRLLYDNMFHKKEALMRFPNQETIFMSSFMLGFEFFECVKRR